MKSAILPSGVFEAENRPSKEVEAAFAQSTENWRLVICLHLRAPPGIAVSPLPCVAVLLFTVPPKMIRKPSNVFLTQRCNKAGSRSSRAPLRSCRRAVT